MSVCPGGRFYDISPGDTLFAIAQRFGTTVEEILRVNPQITNPNVLSVGQRICIPVRLAECEGTLYTVKAGDTLFALARRFGTTVAEILRANPGVTPENLQVGEVLCLPRAVAGRRCIVLAPTDLAPRSEGFAYLSSAAPAVVAGVFNVPRPEELPGGEVYRLTVNQLASDAFETAEMTECLPGHWFGRVDLPWPVSEVGSILISAEPAGNVGLPLGTGVATAIIAVPE